MYGSKSYSTELGASFLVGDGASALDWGHKSQVESQNCNQQNNNNAGLHENSLIEADSF